MSDGVWVWVARAGCDTDVLMALSLVFKINQNYPSIDDKVPQISVAIINKTGSSS